MQVSVKTIQGLWRRISIIIPGESISKIIKKELDNTAKRVCINGFRKGKVPREIIKQRYGVSILNEVLMEVMQRSFIDVIMKEKINPIGKPNYLPGKYKIDKDFNFNIEFEVYPDIQLNALNHIKVEKPLVKITDNDVDTMLEALRQYHSTWKEGNYVTESKNRVTIDFSGLINGKEFKGSKGSDFVLVIGHNRMPSSFEKGLLGHKVGETFTIDVIFPEGYHTEELRGKKAIFTILLKRIEGRELAHLSEEFIKQFGIRDTSVDSLRAEVRKNMEREMKKAVRNHIKAQVIDGLVSATCIDVPAVLIDHEVNILRDQAQKHLINDKKQALELPHASLEEQAKQRATARLLLSEVITANNLKVDHESVKNLIKEIASTYQEPREVIKLYSKNTVLMQNVRNIVLEQQAVDFLLEKVQVTEKKINFSNFINQS